MEDSEFNRISIHVESELSNYLESDLHHNKFLKDLCQQEKGKWIIGNDFASNDTYFDKGSKCSYETREKCDKSYNWSYFKNGTVGNEIKIKDKFIALKNFVRGKDEIKDNLVKKAENLLPKTYISETIDEIKDYWNKMVGKLNTINENTVTADIVVDEEFTNT